jgi:hypothetical protein
MKISEDKIVQAFRVYRELARDGVAGVDASNTYRSDDEIRALLDLFAKEMDCVIVIVGYNLYLIPESRMSPFHVNNEWIKRNVFKAGAVNADIYLLYFATMILFGAFYDSYQTKEATREFFRMDEWVREVHTHIQSLKEHDDEKLQASQEEFSYNWLQIIQKWDDMNDLKESAKRQVGNTISRLSFMDTVKRFLVDQDLLIEIGNEEITLSEKAKTVVSAYFMNLDYNKGIFEFIYGGRIDANN